MRAYFVTGVTGVIGSEVLRLLLNDPDNTVHVLIRGVGDLSAEQRLAQLLAFLGFAAGDVGDRIVLLQGDVALPAFGLTNPDYDLVVHGVSRIIHCAGNVKSNLPEQQARAIAVGSVEAVIKLAEDIARSGRLEKVEVVSTVGVAGRDTMHCVEARIEHAREFHNSYEKAKAEAENIVWSAIDRGLPATLHRPSMVIGNTRNGQVRSFQVFYYISEFLSGARTAGFLPRFGDARLDLIPVDYVAEAIIWSSGQAGTTGKVLHLTSGAHGSVRLSELIPRVRSAFARGGKLLPSYKPVPAGLFRALVPLMQLFVPRRDRGRIRTLGFFLDYLRERHNFQCVETDSLLRQGGVEKPDSPAYLDKVLDYYIATKGN